MIGSIFFDELYKQYSWYDSVLSLILFDVNEVVDSYYKDYYNDLVIVSFFK